MRKAQSLKGIKMQSLFKILFFGLSVSASTPSIAAGPDTCGVYEGTGKLDCIDELENCKIVLFPNSSKEVRIQTSSDDHLFRSWSGLKVQFVVQILDVSNTNNYKAELLNDINLSQAEHQLNLTKATDCTTE